MLVGIGTGFAIVLSVQIYIGWQADPVLTSVSTTGYDIQKMEYPAITICAQGSVNEVVGNEKRVTFQERAFNNINQISLQMQQFTISFQGG